MTSKSETDFQTIYGNEEHQNCWFCWQTLTNSCFEAMLNTFLLIWNKLYQHVLAKGDTGGKQSLKEA